MYTYKLYLFVTYLLGLRWSFLISVPLTEATNNITFDLSKLKEHGNVSERVDKFKLKETTFTTPEGKAVERVVYDGANVWVSSENQNKVLKKIVASYRNSIPQLLRLVLSNTSGGSAREENVYYKKEKTQFTAFDQSKYTEFKGKLDRHVRFYVNEWFPINFAKPEVFSESTRKKRDLEDGVWKNSYTLLHGTVSVVKDGDTNLWTHAGDNKNVSSLELLEFGNDNSLLTISIGSDKKYFHKSHPTRTWESLADESAFLTKAKNFKTSFFSSKLDYDLSSPPTSDKFHIKRNQHSGNYNELYLHPLSQYYLGLVKYKETPLWTAERNTRVLHLKLDLLYHEVKIAQVIYSVPETGPFPQKKVVCFFKNNDGVFKQASDRAECTKHINIVEASINKSTQFVYNDTWPSQPKPLDLRNFNREELTIVPNNRDNGVKEETLTPKATAPLNGLTFGAVVLWPPLEPAVTKPNVTQVVIVTKNSLLQLVHLQATKAGTTLRRGVRVPSDTTERVDLYFKKSGENFTPVQDSSAFDRFKQELLTGSQVYDNSVHLDLNLETLNTDLYTVTTTSPDGVTMRVVEPKQTIQVTKLFTYTTNLWVRPSRSPKFVLMKYELYSYVNKKLLKLHIGNFGQQFHLIEEYYEKRDFNVAWTKFDSNFNNKVVEFKSAANLTQLDLDVSVKPSLTDYSVEVNPLSGNKTKLVLAPVQGKKITKVKHGTHVFFTADNNRAHKVELYLEDYAVKFVKLFIWKDVLNASPLLTEEKHFKDVTTAGTTWTSTNFDEKLREFETTASTVPFTYSPDWVLPSMTFDPKTSHRFYFQSSDQTEGLVTTTTYTPKEGTVVNNVLYDRSKVWPANEDGSGDTAKKLVHLKVLSKNDMVQLLQLRNALVATPNTTEDLYYKKVMDTYVKLDSENAFNDLKGTLSKEDTYVDQNVKLDLSSTEETSTKLFEKETTLEDGVEKTVVVVKAGKLFQVSASPPLWTSTNGEYVTKLERYVLDLTQFLVLHITKRDNTTETKFYEKPVAPPQEREEPRGSTGHDPGRPEQQQQESQVQEQQQQESQVQEQQQQESQVQELGPPAAPARTPSFSDLGGLDAFYIKLNKAKAAVAHDEVPLDVSAYQGNDKFEVKETTEGTATLFKVYPKKAHWVTRLVNGSNNDLWTNPQEGERLVEAFLYVHDRTLKFVKAVVWPNNRTSSSQDKLFHFKLEGERLVSKTPEAFKKELEELTKVPPTPLSVEKYAPPEPTPYFFHKLYLSDRVDTDIFEFTETNAGAYKLKKYAAKQHKFVNVVETQHGLLWKAEDREDYMKSTFFAVKENSALAHLTVSANSELLHLFFKFDDDKWDRLDTDTYRDLYSKAGLPSS